MGWWSATVLGGDPPLDWLGTLCVWMGIERNYDDGDKQDDDRYYGYPYTRELLESNLDKLVGRIREKCLDEAHIAFQVLGAMLLDVGADIPTEVKTLICRACLVDGWANEADKERLFYMTDLHDKIRAHKPGEKTELAVEGLMDKIAEVLS